MGISRYVKKISDWGKRAKKRFASGDITEWGLIPGLTKREGEKEYTETMRQLEQFGAKSADDVAVNMWNRYLSMYAPLEQQLISEAKKPAAESPGYLGAIGQYERGMGDVSANLRRTLGGRYPYGAGIEASTQASLARQRPLGRATLRSSAEQERMNRLYNLVGLGKGMESTAASAQLGAGQLGLSQQQLALQAKQLQQNQMGQIGSTLGNLAMLGLAFA